MYSHCNLLAIEICQLSNNIGVSDFRANKLDEILEIMRPV